MRGRIENIKFIYLHKFNNLPKICMKCNIFFGIVLVKRP